MAESFISNRKMYSCIHKEVFEQVLLGCGLFCAWWLCIKSMFPEGARELSEAWWCFGRWVWAAVRGVGLEAVTSPSASGSEICWSFGVNLSGQSERPTNCDWHPGNVNQAVLWSQRSGRALPGKFTMAAASD